MATLYVKGFRRPSTYSFMFFFRRLVRVSLTNALISGVMSLVLDPATGRGTLMRGLIASTVQVLLAGVGSMLPAASIALTRKVCVVWRGP